LGERTGGFGFRVKGRTGREFGEIPITEKGVVKKIVQKKLKGSYQKR